MRRFSGYVLGFAVLLGGSTTLAHGQTLYRKSGRYPSSYAPVSESTGSSTVSRSVVGEQRSASVPVPPAVGPVTERQTVMRSGEPATLSESAVSSSTLAPGATVVSETVVQESNIELAAMQIATVTLDPMANAPSNGQSAGHPRIQLVNSRNLVLEFEIKAVGPSGLGSVNLWFTRNGQLWQKYDGPTQTQSPLVMQLPEDGLYGFTLEAINGAGISHGHPEPGDSPQVWVEVDTTKPAVHLVSTEAGVNDSGRTLTLRWTATDKNLVARPITLCYAEDSNGPWTPFATNVENSGLFIWHMSPGLPNQVLVRVEATDRIGNVGEDKTAMPTPIDLMRPKATITRVGRNGVLQNVTGTTQQAKKEGQTQTR